MLCKLTKHFNKALQHWVDQLLPNLDAVTFYTMAMCMSTVTFYTMAIYICMSNFSLDISSKYLVVESCFVSSLPVFLHCIEISGLHIAETQNCQCTLLNVGAMIFQNTQLPCMCMHEIASRHQITEHVSCIFVLRDEFNHPAKVG